MTLLCVYIRLFLNAGLVVRHTAATANGFLGQRAQVKASGNAPNDMFSESNRRMRFKWINIGMTSRSFAKTPSN
ncbi:hypothetical protein EYF80_038665 [Liparis tanakae]|uniref:Secreted protein n=1 Tax=Liparis tanakae TaxID=230148 RepID=A0A4Z2GEK1_9TELE|nr:hypothetical protein EYF80_038665 [Liparis tanakae]